MSSTAPHVPVAPPPIRVHPPRTKPDFISRKPKIVAPRQSKNHRSDNNPLQKLDTSFQRTSETQIPPIQIPKEPHDVKHNPRFTRHPSTSRPSPPVLRMSNMLPKDPMTPHEALMKYGSLLTPYELTEILNYPEVYFLGTANRKITCNMSDPRNIGFDDSNHHYKLIPGDHLAFRYEILQVLGAGAFGQVCKCLDYKTNTHVAIKVLINTEQLHSQGRIEGQILARINKSKAANCVKAYDFFVFRSHVCLTFEVLGKSLYRLAQDNSFKPFELSVVRSMAHQMFLALDNVHRCGIVHCDLKPENILSVPDVPNAFRLIDFGTSCFDGQQKYSYIQSRFYRAPEVILGLGYGYAMDVWSLALIIIEMLIGRPVFPGHNELEMLSLMIELLGPPPLAMIRHSPRRELFFDSSFRFRANMVRVARGEMTLKLRDLLNFSDRALEDLLMKCLAWDPGHRITAGAALLHPWLNV